MAKLIDGKKIATEIQERISKGITRLEGRLPGLVAILVGDHPASLAYVSKKSEQAELVGIRGEVIRLPETVSEESLLGEIDRLNADPEIDGILVQLPLPPHISSKKVISRIDPTKDVDGFHPINMGKLLIGEGDGFMPCTPLGIKELLLHSKVDLDGAHVVIVGRSNIVGKPLAAILMQKHPNCNATVTLANSATRDLSGLCQTADVLIVAIGQPEFVRKEMVKKGAVVIDVGINRVVDESRPRGSRLVGDVAFEEVRHKASMITPVPGGVGPMTVAMLLQNTWSGYLRRQAATLAESVS